MGFVTPDKAAEERSRLSMWGPSVLVPRSLRDSWHASPGMWPAGLLSLSTHDSPLHICLSSDEEESDPARTDFMHDTTPCVDTLGDNLSCERNSAVLICLDSDVENLGLELNSETNVCIHDA